MLGARIDVRKRNPLSITRSSFRRPHTRIEIPTINTTTFLPITSTTSYLPTFLRSHRLLPTFLPSYDHIDYLLSTYISSTSQKQPILVQPIKTALDFPGLGLGKSLTNHSTRNRLRNRSSESNTAPDLPGLRPGKSLTNHTRDQQTTSPILPNLPSQTSSLNFLHQIYIYRTHQHVST